MAGEPSFNLATFSGYALVILSILLIGLGVSRRQNLRQNLILGIVYLVAGIIFASFGVQITSFIAQIGMLLLTGSTIYWVVDAYRRSANDRSYRISK
jgi:uncharacterized membrane protein YjjP (DUF1212 family)